MANTYLQLLTKTYKEFIEDKAPVFAAALAFLTTFSIAQIAVLIVGIVSIVLGKSAAEGALYNNLNNVIGSVAAHTIQNLIRNTNKSGGSIWATLLGSATLVISATVVVAALKDALNTIWGLKPNPRGIKSVWYMVWSRIVEFSLIVIAAVFFLIFFFATSVLYSVGHSLVGFGSIVNLFLRIGYYLLFILFMFLFFAILFKYLPDARIKWRNVLTGALGTSVLFVLGTFLIGFYLGKVGVGSAFGTAGSLVLILLWVFYSAQIFLFGAEFTQVYTRHQGEKIQPSDNAMFMDDCKKQ